IGGTRGAGARARLGSVTDSGRGATRRAGMARRVLACDIAAVALIQRARVPVVRARGAGRLLRIGGTGVAGPVASLGEIALARRRPAEGAARLHGVGQTVRTIAGAVLRDVASARDGRATHDAARDEAV